MLEQAHLGSQGIERCDNLAFGRHNYNLINTQARAVYAFATRKETIREARSEGIAKKGTPARPRQYWHSWVAAPEATGPPMVIALTAIKLGLRSDYVIQD